MVALDFSPLVQGTRVWELMADHHLSLWIWCSSPFASVGSFGCSSSTTVGACDSPRLTLCQDLARVIRQIQKIEFVQYH